MEGELPRTKRRNRKVVKMKVTIQDAFRPHLERLAKVNNRTVRDEISLGISYWIKILTLKKKGKK